MKNYIGPIIDTHTHIYPEKIAEKATKAVGEFYDTEMDCLGTVENLKKHMKTAGVGFSFILSTATVPHQVRAINNFLIDVMKDNEDCFLPFGTVHPDMENIVEELDFIRENGIFGLKFHPDFQGFAVDDKKMDVVYEYAQEYKIPMIFHAGDKRYHYSNPIQFKRIIEKFPRIIAIAAHFGGYTELKDSFEYLCGTNYYFDTSSTFGFSDYDIPKQILKKHDSERILFASDFPMWKPEDEILNIEKLNLSSERLEKVMYKNAKNLIASTK